MERIYLEERNNENAAVRAAEILRAGGVIVYPTDTLYGLGADALSDDAVAKIYDIKEREEGKPVHVVVADIAAAERYAEVDERARLLAEEFLPGPLTIILKKKSGIMTGVGKHLPTIGIRIPDNAFCRALAREYDAPFTTTSANKSGMPPLRTIDDVVAQLAGKAGHVGLCIDAGELPESKPSTVVDVSAETPHILREGAVPASEIKRVLGI